MTDGKIINKTNIFQLLSPILLIISEYAKFKWFLSR